MIRIAAVATAVATTLVFAAGDAAAQRGADYIDQSEPDHGPRADFPGIFDTTTLRAGQSLFSLPALGLDYGISDDLSVGSNGLVMASVLGGRPSLFLRARYRFHASARWRAVLDATGAASGTVGNGQGEAFFGNFLMFGANVSRRLGPAHTITGSALVYRFAAELEEGGEASRIKSGFSGAVVAVTHELIPARWFSLRTSLIFAPAVRGSVDQIGATATIEIGGTQALLERNALRVLASVRAGRRWLITGGGLLVAFSPYALPWLSVAKIF